MGAVGKLALGALAVAAFLLWSLGEVRGRHQELCRLVDEHVDGFIRETIADPALIDREPELQDVAGGAVRLLREYDRLLHDTSSRAQVYQEWSVSGCVTYATSVEIGCR